MCSDAAAALISFETDRRENEFCNTSNSCLFVYIYICIFISKHSYGIFSNVDLKGFRT